MQINQDSQIDYDGIEKDIIQNETYDQIMIQQVSMKALKRKNNPKKFSFKESKKYRNCQQILREIQNNRQTQSKKKWESSKSFNLKQVRKNGSIKKLVSRRIYLCGACLLNFNFKVELQLHIQRQHVCQIPEGTIFGLKKEKLLKLFNIPYIKPAIPIQKKLFLFKCGCGNEYNCSYLLSFHIKISHNNIEPIGTIGIVRSIKIYEK